MALGLSFRLELSADNLQTMDLAEQMMLAKKAEELGFSSLFVRDSPLYDPNFGDNGIMYSEYCQDIATPTSPNEAGCIFG